MSIFKKTQVKDTTDTLINPATKENQTNGSQVSKIHLVDEFGVQSQMLGDNMYGGAPVMIDIPHHEIHCGDSFTCSYNASLGNGASSDILLVVPNEAVKRFHLTVNIGVGTEVTYFLYEDATTSANGTALAWYNRERNSVLTTSLSISHTPTVTTTGTAIDTDRFGAKQTASSVERSEEFVLKNNTKYLLRVTNGSGNASFVSWKLNHYIHPGQ
jgi:hypothetical protein